MNGQEFRNDLIEYVITDGPGVMLVHAIGVPVAFDPTKMKHSQTVLITKARLGAQPETRHG